MKVTRDKSGKVGMAIMIAAVLVLCLGAGGCIIGKGKSGKDGKKVELKQWKLDEFLVNLADRDENRYLKVNLVLEVKGDPPAAAGGEGGAGGGSTDEIKARDAVITVLTKKSYRDLVSEQGKASLKAELKAALNGTLENIKVENIYFTSFAMQ